MKLAIMQPYFLPYLGYFQLIGAVDRFVIYDQIKYTKKGWINRNRMLVNGSDSLFSLPLVKGSDSLDVVEREIAPDFVADKLLAQFAGAYHRAPHFEQTFELLKEVVGFPERNLFHYIHHSVVSICRHLGIETEIVVSSTLPFDNGLKGQDKVLAICKAAGAAAYVNPIGGTELYETGVFADHGLQLRFIKSRHIEYPQLGATFVPWLSIVDVLMFNPLSTARAMVADQYDYV